MAADRWESVVFIDMDHTLLEGPFEKVVFPQVLGEIAQKTGLEFEVLLKAARKENLDRQFNPGFSPAQAMDWDDIFTQIAGQLGVTLHTNAQEIVQAHPGPPHAFLYPGAREALEQLASARYRRALVLATKGLRKYQLPVLEALGLLSFFDDILTPESNQAFKQSLTFYGRWPKITRTQIMVGDTYEDDVLPAHQFGFRTVWRARLISRHFLNTDPLSRSYDQRVTSEGQLIRPDAVIYSLSELPKVVDRLEQNALSS